MEQSHKDCRVKLAKFNSHVRICDPQKNHVNTIHKKYDDWTKKLETLLMDLVEAVGNFTIEHDVTTEVKKEWEDIVEASQDSLISTVNAMEDKLASSRDALPVQTSASSSSNQDGNKMQAATVDVRVYHGIITSEMLVKDSMQKKEQKVPPMKPVKQRDGFVVASNCQRSCNCCCRGHCSLAKDYHSKNGKVSGVNLAKLDVKLEKDELEFPFMFEKDLDEEDAYLSMYGLSRSNLEFNDPLYETLVAMETNFSMEN